VECDKLSDPLCAVAVVHLLAGTIRSNHWNRAAGTARLFSRVCERVRASLIPDSRVSQFRTQTEERSLKSVVGNGGGNKCRDQPPRGKEPPEMVVKGEASRWAAKYLLPYIEREGQAPYMPDPCDI